MNNIRTCHSPVRPVVRCSSSIMRARGMHQDAPTCIPEYDTLADDSDSGEDELEAEIDASGSAQVLQFGLSLLWRHYIVFT